MVLAALVCIAKWVGGEAQYPALIPFLEHPKPPKYIISIP